jgi:hypothetical protein
MEIQYQINCVSYDLETGSHVGTGPNKGSKTKIRVHVDFKGEAHGHPARREL